MYEIFKKELVKEIILQLDSTYKIKISSVLKTNSKQDAICIYNKETTMIPNIYLSCFYDDYKNGITIKNIASKIISINSQKPNIEFDAQSFLSYEIMKNSIVYKLINTSLNTELLTEIPSISYFDLSIVFQVIVNENATILIRNSHLALWQVDTSELLNQAQINTPIQQKATIENMDSIFNDMLSKEPNSACINLLDSNVTSFDDDFMNMYVLSNQAKMNGAACILYPDALQTFSKKLNKNFYIIPSSIHEVILVPDTGTIVPSDLTSMIISVNEEQLSADEILSNHPYYYNHHTLKISSGE